MSELLKQVKSITASQVAKKQDAAKLNLPKIIAKIKAQAALGESEAIFHLGEINQYDIQLLEAEGFGVNLVDTTKRPYDSPRQYNPIEPKKEWKIIW